MRSACARWLLAVALVACAGPPSTVDAPLPATASARPLASTAPATRKVITVVGTNDLHGRVRSLPLFGGYVDRIRALRATDGGVLLVDGGDMFQGTLESNTNEGAAVVEAYNVLGYAAAAVGNHEFDFGPEGPPVTVRAPGDDPRGALKRAAAKASFPFLIANVTDRATGKPWLAPNIQPDVMIEVAGVRVGIVGITTSDTPRTTFASNVADLVFEPLATSVVRSAEGLRKAGATVLVLVAHAGGKCKRFGGDVTADECALDSEIFEVARALPPGLVDVIVAGHTHAGVAHTVNGIAITESLAYGRSFGRVDLVVEGGRLIEKKLHAPRALCPSIEGSADETCDPGEYEGAKITRSARVEAVVAPYLEKARALRAELLGPSLTASFSRSYDQESAVGNLFTDLMREAAGGGALTVTLFNGGGLRTDLPAGPLRYGDLFEAFPFDNRMARVTLDGLTLKRVLAAHIQNEKGGILSMSGMSVSASCKGETLEVEVKRASGARIKDSDVVDVVASDFMLLGGDAFWGGITAPEIKIDDELVRDAMVRVLKGKKSLDPKRFFDPDKRRFSLSDKRPIRCAKK